MGTSKWPGRVYTLPTVLCPNLRAAVAKLFAMVGSADEL